MEAYEGPYNRNDKKNYSTDPRTAEFFLLYQIRVSDEPIYLESNFCYLIYFENLRCANYFLILEALYFKMLYLRCHLQLRGIADRSYILSSFTSLSLSLSHFYRWVGRQVDRLAGYVGTSQYHFCFQVVYQHTFYDLYSLRSLRLFECLPLFVLSLLGCFYFRSLSKSLFMFSLFFYVIYFLFLSYISPHTLYHFKFAA